MKRGEIWQVDLGGKAGTRPALILTRSAVIPFLNKVTVAEITSHSKGYPTEVDIDQKTNLPQPSFVQVDNIQTVPQQRLLKYMGTLSEDDMRLVSEKVILALSLEDAVSAT